MKILVALPDHPYFLWQVLVQMNNFKKFGYDKDTIYVIGVRGSRRSDILKKIISKSRGSVYTYKDERENLQYSSALRPHILKKLFKDRPELGGEAIFYIDPDVLFTKKIKFEDLEKDDTWYVSDTRSYIGTDYIKSKSESLLRRMCSVVGVQTTLVEENDAGAGGAQYLMKNLDSAYWEEVETASMELYDLMIKTSDEYSPDHPIQAWTADMWAVLWVAWKYGNKTEIIKRFEFAWATDLIKKWKTCGIYHNAGVVNGADELFNKTEYQRSPFNKELNYSDKYCSYNYVKEIKETEQNFKEILF